VLLVPSAALKFQPSTEMLKDLRAEMEKRFAGMPDSVRAAFRNGRAGSGGRQGSSMNGGAPGSFGSFTPPPNSGQLYYLDDKGKPSMSFVKTGATDGKMTEIVRGRGVDEGVKVIIGYTQPSKDKTPTPQTQQPRGMGGPPRLF
jgi:hypothetical protein